MLRIPVRKGGGVPHFPDRPVGVAAFAAQAAGKRQRIDPVENRAADVEHLRADQGALDNRILQHFSGLVQNPPGERGSRGGLPGLFENSEVAQEQPGMLRRVPFEQLPDLVRGRFPRRGAEHGGGKCDQKRGQKRFCGTESVSEYFHFS